MEINGSPITSPNLQSSLLETWNSLNDGCESTAIAQVQQVIECKNTQRDQFVSSLIKENEQLKRENTQITPLRNQFIEERNRRILAEERVEELEGIIDRAIDDSADETSNRLWHEKEEAYKAELRAKEAKIIELENRLKPFETITDSETLFAAWFKQSCLLSDDKRHLLFLRLQQLVQQDSPKDIAVTMYKAFHIEEVWSQMPTVTECHQIFPDYPPKKWRSVTKQITNLVNGTASARLTKAVETVDIYSLAA